MQEPKSRAGYRAIPLLEPARKAIPEFRAWKEKEGVSVVEPIDGFDNFVFLTRRGWPLTSSAVNYALLRTAKGINKDLAAKGTGAAFPRISCHWPRRTLATRMSEVEASMKIAQHALGHEDTNLTSRIYVSAQEGFVNNEMAKLMSSADFASL